MNTKYKIIKRLNINTPYLRRDLFIYHHIISMRYHDFVDNLFLLKPNRKRKEIKDGSGVFEYLNDLDV